MSGNTLRKSGAYRFRAPGAPALVTPRSLKELTACLAPPSGRPPPFRPRGAGSSSTDCNAAVAGTVIDMTALNAIRDVDFRNFTVTVQAGMRLEQLADALGEDGLELEGSYDLVDRTVGGAIAGGCIGPAIGGDGALFASQVCRVRMVTPDGRMLRVDGESRNLLNAIRLSYGMLGVIHEATLRVRPVRPFAASHRRCAVATFAASIERIMKSRVGLKFYLLPFRDRVYLDLRRYDSGAADGRRLPWRLKDWGESTVLPQVLRSLNRIVPVAGVRYRLIDHMSRLTQGLVNNRLVSRGSNRASHGSGGRALHYSTWLFPAADFGSVVRGYVDLCRKVHETTGFRCDMPTTGFRVAQDRSALLSPTFDQPMCALRAMSTQLDGWEDFAIDLADFARERHGVPFFNQSRSLGVDHARAMFGPRLTFFHRIRRRLDPNDRMMNPFLSQYFL